jgi:hypothetical protein
MRADRHRHRGAQISSLRARGFRVHGVELAAAGKVWRDRDRIQTGGQTGPVGETGGDRRQIEILAGYAVGAEQVETATLVDDEVPPAAIAQGRKMIDAGPRRVTRPRSGGTGRCGIRQ